MSESADARRTAQREELSVLGFRACVVTSCASELSERVESLSSQHCATAQTCHSAVHCATAPKVLMTCVCLCVALQATCKCRATAPVNAGGSPYQINWVQCATQPHALSSTDVYHSTNLYTTCSTRRLLVACSRSGCCESWLRSHVVV